jgi:hypothetical protein
MRNALLLLCVLLGGCVSAADCASDWYTTGQRDGRLNAYQAELYASHCTTTVDRARYDQGWQEGFAQRPRIAAF